MTIKEVEQELGIPRASIRFYEKERLIEPKREENGYREYDERDVATLRKVIIFRKLGLPVSEIEEILDGAKSLPDALGENIAKLQEQLAELNGAIELSKTIQKTGVDIAAFDENYYWEEMNREEERGSRFMDIAKDIGQYQKTVFLEQFGLADCEGNLRCTMKEAVFAVISISLIWGGMRWLLTDRSLRQFVAGLVTPFLVVVVLVIFGYPIHCLAKKHLRIARYEKAIVFLVAIAVAIIVIGLLKE